MNEITENGQLRDRLRQAEEKAIRAGWDADTQRAMMFEHAERTEKLEYDNAALRSEIEQLKKQRDEMFRVNNADLERRRQAEAESRERLVQIHALVREILHQRDTYSSLDERFRQLCRATGGLGGENIYDWCADRLEEFISRADLRTNPWNPTTQENP